jgi:hypothetical protein
MPCGKVCKSDGRIIVDKWSDVEIESALTRLHELTRHRSDPLSKGIQSIVKRPLYEETSEPPTSLAERLQEAISLMWPLAFPSRETPFDHVAQTLTELAGVPVHDIEIADGKSRISFRREVSQPVDNFADEDLRDLFNCLPESDSLEESELDSE